jgi:hypothetical protein
MRKATGKKVVMPQEREPGRELFIDWIGDKVPCVIDMETGKHVYNSFICPHTIWYRSTAPVAE